MEYHQHDERYEQVNPRKPVQQEAFPLRMGLVCYPLFPANGTRILVLWMLLQRLKPRKHLFQRLFVVLPLHDEPQLRPGFDRQ